jgi:PIN domain nuclease of toxin-antitoxin system
MRRHPDAAQRDHTFGGTDTKVLTAQDAELLVSAATVWERAIRRALGGCSCRTRPTPI